MYYIIGYRGISFIFISNRSDEFIGFSTMCVHFLFLHLMSTEDFTLIINIEDIFSVEF